MDLERQRELVSRLVGAITHMGCSLKSLKGVICGCGFRGLNFFKGGYTGYSKSLNPRPWDTRSLS